MGWALDSSVSKLPESSLLDADRVVIQLRPETDDLLLDESGEQ
jgi:hypothetical protein